MNKECKLSFQHYSLFQQGYQRFSPAELKQLEWGLRFTPAACSLITAYALYAQLPGLLLLVAGLGIWAFFFPAAHPMDLLYNHGVRHLFAAVKLPENPFQRRLACFAAGLMNTTAAILFLAGFPVAAIVVGVSLLALQMIVITTHFCTLSWMYEGLMRVLGKWQVPLQEEAARELIRQGAKLVDVRSQNEYARETIDGTLNLPLEELDRYVQELKQGVFLLFCNSGTRSHIAAEKLKGHGIEGSIHNLGSLDRAREIIASAA